MSQIIREEIEGKKILHLQGQFIGGEQTDELRDTLKKMSEESDNNVALDFKDVTYLNSTAIGVLISAHASFVKRNGKIILCNVNDSIMNIFKITKLTLVFSTKDTIDEALKSL